MNDEIKFTKLEQFIRDNPRMGFDVIAIQLNRTIGQCERAYDRMRKKELRLEQKKPILPFGVAR